MKNNVYQEITEKIIAQLSKGIIPWEQPWFGTRGAISHSTGESYSLLNQMILGGESGEYITLHQIQMLEGRIIKGSTGRELSKRYPTYEPSPFFESMIAKASRIAGNRNKGTQQRCHP